MNPVFSVSKFISDSFHDVIKNISFILPIGLIQYLNVLNLGLSASLHILLSIIVSFVLAGFTLGALKALFVFHETGESDLNLVLHFFSYNTFKYVVIAWLATILFKIGTVFFIILLIIPGIIFYIRCGYYRYVIVQEGAGPIVALKRSAQITKGHLGNLFLLSLATTVILFVSGITIIGPIFILPMNTLAFIRAYKLIDAHQIKW